jgi:AbrB family looped-hinge helix DNA binding protein
MWKMYKIIDEKGRVTIPRDLRDTLRMQPNTIVSLNACAGCLAIRPEKICDNCKGETRGKEVIEAFRLLSAAEREAVLKHMNRHGKGCDCE